MLKIKGKKKFTILTGFFFLNASQDLSSADNFFSLDTGQG